MRKALALPLELVRHEPRLLARFILASVGRAALDRLVAGRLVVTVANRLSTLRNATRIPVRSGGRAVGLGTHHELLSRCEAYRILWEAQSGEPAQLPLRHAEAS